MGCSTCSQLWLPSDDESQHQDKEGRLQPPNITHGFQKGKTAAQPSELPVTSHALRAEHKLPGWAHSSSRKPKRRAGSAGAAPLESRRPRGPRAPRGEGRFLRRWPLNQEGGEGARRAVEWHHLRAAEAEHTPRGALADPWLQPHSKIGGRKSGNTHPLCGQESRGYLAQQS